MLLHMFPQRSNGIAVGFSGVRHGDREFVLVPTSARPLRICRLPRSSLRLQPPRHCPGHCARRIGCPRDDHTFGISATASTLLCFQGYP